MNIDSGIKEVDSFTDLGVHMNIKLYWSAPPAEETEVIQGHLDPVVTFGVFYTLCAKTVNYKQWKEEAG